MKKFLPKLILFLCIIGGFSIFKAQNVSAQDTNNITYQIKGNWSSGFIGEFQITNTGTEPIEYWNLEFDLDENITGIWGAKIVSHEGKHYIISYESWDSVISAGDTISIGFSSDSMLSSTLPSNMILTDILDKLEDQDAEWKNYTNMIDYQNYQKSFADFFLNYFGRFESDSPHQLGYQLIEKNPVWKFTNSSYENISIPTSDGLFLKGLFFPVKDSKGTIVVIHGRGNNMYWTIQNIQFLIDNGYQVLLYNARYWNYYNDPESYSQSSYACNFEDAINASVYLKTRTDVNPAKIGIYGFSFGANKAIVAGGLSDNYKVIISDGASVFPFFTENDGAISGTLPSNWYDVKEDIINVFSEKFNITREEMKTYDYDIRMKAMTKPVLILHGMEDPYVSLAEAQKFYHEASGPKEIYTFEHAGHCNAVFTEDKTAYETAVLNFLEQYLS